MLLILMMLVENKGRVNQLDLAAKLKDWMHHGFKDLGDYGEPRSSSLVLVICITCEAIT